MKCFHKKYENYLSSKSKKKILINAIKNLKINLSKKSRKFKKHLLKTNNSKVD